MLPNASKSSYNPINPILFCTESVRLAFTFKSKLIKSSTIEDRFKGMFKFQLHEATSLHQYLSHVNQS